MKPLLLQNAKIFDGTGKIIEKGFIRIEGSRIVACGPMVEAAHAAASYEVHDLDGRTILPGLIDGHVHITLDASADAGKGAGSASDAAIALQTAGNAARTLAAGITTVRDLGGMNFINLAVRDAITAGHIPGPRILSAGQNICMTGGHGWRFGREADGPDGVRQAVREQCKAGADVIKFMSTGGTLTKTGKPGQTQLTEAEIRAGIEEAHKAGLRTATHAKGIEATRFAVRSGIDSVEHASMLDEELIEWMVKGGVYVVPTLKAGANIIEKGVSAGIPEWAVEKAKRYRPERINSLSKAKSGGVKVAFGTDAGTPFNCHGENASELVHIQEIGFSIEEALVSATSLNAEMMGLQEIIGTLSAGYIADVIVVKGDPIKDLTLLTDFSNIEAVYQNGVKVAAYGRLIR